MQITRIAGLAVWPLRRLGQAPYLTTAWPLLATIGEPFVTPNPSRICANRPALPLYLSSPTPQVRTNRTASGWAVVKTWCVPVLKVKQRGYAPCTPKKAYTQVKLLLAQQQVGV